MLGTEQVLPALSAGAELFGCGDSFRGYTPGLCVLLMQEQITWSLCLKGFFFVVFHLLIKAKEKEGKTGASEVKGTKTTHGPLPW